MGKAGAVPCHLIDFHNIDSAKVLYDKVEALGKHVTTMPLSAQSTNVRPASTPVTSTPTVSARQRDTIVFARSTTPVTVTRTAKSLTTAHAMMSATNTPPVNQVNTASDTLVNAKKDTPDQNACQMIHAKLTTVVVTSMPSVLHDSSVTM